MALTLNGTTGIAGIAGSAGTPALQGNNDANTGYFFGTDILGLSTAGTERLRIEADGQIQIGLVGLTGGNDQALTITEPGGSANVLELATSNASGRINFSRNLSSTLNTTSYIEWTEPGAQGTGELRFGTSPSSNNPTERLRITSHGQIAIRNNGTTSQSSNLIVYGDADNSDVAIFSGGDWSRGLKISTAASGNNDALVIFDAQNADNGCFSFKTHGDERLRITSNGTVISGATSVSGGNRSQFSILAAVSNNTSATGHGVFTIQAGANSSSGNEVAQLCFSDPQGDYAWIQAFADAATGSTDKPGRLVFSTSADGAAIPTERLRIKSDGETTIGTGSVNIAKFCQSGNKHQIIGQAADNVAALDVYSQHGSSAAKISFAVSDNRTGSKKNTFVVRGDGSLILDSTNNGYGGLRIYDDSGGDYNVRYVAGRNQSATSHVFMQSGRTQNQSPWADATPQEHARITRGGIAFGGDTAAANTLDDYEHGSLNLTLTASGGGSISYSYRQGYYTKIGNIVHVVGDIRLNGSWSGSGGDLYMNLPFTSSTNGGCVGGGTCGEWNTNSNDVGGVFIKVDNNESIARFTFHNNNGNNNTNPFTSGYLNNGRWLKFSYTYYTHL